MIFWNRFNLLLQYFSFSARDNTSAIIEVRLRPKHAQWRYHLDVFAAGRRVYFDRASLRVQRFPGEYIMLQSVM
jgi:hypothetical protein